MPDRASYCPHCGTPAGWTETLDSASPLSGSSPVALDAAEEGRFPAGTVLADRYRIIELLGRGGMGEVYRAHDLTLHQTVALKFLPELEEKNQALRSRLLHEVRIARRITHPNVCRVYDLGEIDGKPFLSMEYIDGEDLSSLLHRVGRLPPDRAVEIARQLCAGLDAAHCQGILHRDLKPANLMIDGHGQAHITDFGMAELVTSFGNGVTGGTPAYMAPELRDGASPQIPSDLYALGLVLYEMFTGRRPDEACPASLLELVPDLDPALDALVLRCLARDAAERPRSAAEVEAALPGSGEEGSLGWRPAAGLAIPTRPRWHLDRRLGAGGFGDVWLAEHAKTGERRVFKFCYDDQELRSLRREITLFRLLKEELGEREDITRILDWNFEDAPYFIESEYTAGGNLPDWAAEQGGIDQVPLEVRLEIVAQVATALAAAHSVGVLHKDVKPANVLITPDAARAGGVRAQLTDFGIGAVTEDTRLAAAGITVAGWTELAEAAHTGTRLYMAPEQMEGKSATLQGDIFALGVTLYQMIVGDLTRALASGWERDIDDELLCEDVAHAVDGSPERRCASAAELAERVRSLPQRRRARRDAERGRRAQKVRKVVALVATATALVAALVAGAAALQSRRLAREAEVTRQVSEFLVDLFEESDPDMVLERNALAREILDEGARRIETELSRQPAIRARLTHTMGRVYGNLGFYDEAERLLTEALEVRRQVHGEEHLAVAQSLTVLAAVLGEAGKLEKGESMAREALFLRRRLLDEGHPEVAETLEALGEVLRLQGAYAEAEPLLRQALTIRERGSAVQEVSESLNSLAFLLHEMGRLDESELLLHRAVDIGRQLHADGRPGLSDSLHNLAQVLMAKARFEEAEVLYREALELNRQRLGEDHPDVAEGLNLLSFLLRSTGELGEAEALAREALEINRSRLGDHLAVASDLIHLGLVLMEKGDNAAAEPLFRDALALRRRFLGEEHRYVASSLNALAYCLRESGQLDAADELFLEALDMGRRLLEDDDPWLPVFMTNLAENRRRMGDLSAAEPLAREALDRLRQIFKPEHWRVCNAEAVLGDVLAELGLEHEAEPLLREAYGSLHRHKGARAYSTRVALEKLVRFYERFGPPEEATLYRDRLAATAPPT